ncbi:MAG: hypothetical protein WC789_14530, partial [Lentisphaeria bacterium]
MLSTNCTNFHESFSSGPQGRPLGSVIGPMGPMTVAEVGGTVSGATLALPSGTIYRPANFLAGRQVPGRQIPAW